MDLPLGDYRRKVFTEKLKAVVEQDRKDLQEYLIGKIDTCPQIDIAAAEAYTANNQSIETIADEAVPLPVESRPSKTKASQASSASAEAVLPAATATTSHKSHKRSADSRRDSSLDFDLVRQDMKALAPIRAQMIPALTKSSVLRSPSTVRSLLFLQFFS